MTDEYDICSHLSVICRHADGTSAQDIYMKGVSCPSHMVTVASQQLPECKLVLLQCCEKHGPKCE